MSPWVLMREGTSIPSPYINPSYIAILYKRLIAMNCHSILRQPFKYDSTPRLQVFSLFVFHNVFF